MEDLAQEFYEGKLPNPLDLTTEIQKEYEEWVHWLQTYLHMKSGSEKNI